MAILSEECKAEPDDSYVGIRGKTPTTYETVTEEAIKKKSCDKLIIDDSVVDRIATEWSRIVGNMNNKTIILCSMIDEMSKQYPEASVRNLLMRVSNHDKIKKYISISRLFSGLRLIRKRPDLLNYIKMSEEEKAQLSYNQKPYLKKDGDVFWEFYFELEKSGLTDMHKRMLEKDGKDNMWSFRELKRAIREFKDSIQYPTGQVIEYKRKKYELIKRVTAMIRALPVSDIEKIEQFIISNISVDNAGYKVYISSKNDVQTVDGQNVGQATESNCQECNGQNGQLNITLGGGTQ